MNIAFINKYNMLSNTGSINIRLMLFVYMPTVVYAEEQEKNNKKSENCVTCFAKWQALAGELIIS